MPKHKWTMENLKTISNKDLNLALIDERRSDLHEYSKMSPRLDALRLWVEANMPQDGQGSEEAAVPDEEPEPPSDAGASQPTLDGEEAPKRTGSYRKPAGQKPRGPNRPPVILSPTQEAAVVRDYQDELEPSTIPGMNEFPRFGIEEIKGRNNTTSGELYRILHRHKIPLSRIRRQKALTVGDRAPLTQPAGGAPETTPPATEVPPTTKDTLNEDVKRVFAGLKERRGWATALSAAEAKAIRWMLGQGYSVEQILSVRDKIKKQKFWAEKPLYMMSVQSQIGEILKHGV